MDDWITNYDDVPVIYDSIALKSLTEGYFCPVIEQQKPSIKCDKFNNQSKIFSNKAWIEFDLEVA